MLGAGDDTGTITSVREMIARFRNSPPRSREERLKVTAQKEPRLWWEKGASDEKSALREIGSDTIIKKYGLLKDAGDFKMSSRIEKGGGTASLLDYSLAAAESREDETDGLRASYARQSHESLSRFRSSLRDSWGAGSSDARFLGGRQSSSYNDVVNLRASGSLGPGGGYRSLLRDDLRLDGSQDLLHSRAAGSAEGPTADKAPIESSPRDLSKLPAVQAGLDELLAKLRSDSLELQRMYDSALGPADDPGSPLRQPSQQNQQEPSQTQKVTEREQECDWSRVIAEIEKNTFDVAAVEARDRAARDKARAEQDKRMRQVGKFEEQWQHLFPENGEPGGLSFTFPIVVPPRAPSPPPRTPDQHQQQHQQQHHQHQHQQQQYFDQQEEEGEPHFRRSGEGHPWVLEKDQEIDPDEHWRQREHREFLKSQRRGEVVKRRAAVPESTGRGCWQGFGRFSPVDVLATADEARDPRWVQSRPARPAGTRPDQDEDLTHSHHQYAPPMTGSADGVLEDDSAYLPRRMLELEAAEQQLQREIEQQRARMQRPSSPRPAQAPVSPRTVSAPSSPRPASPRRETFSILQGRDPLPYRLALDFSLDNVLGREGRGPPRHTLSRGPPLVTMAQAARAPAALELPDYFHRPSDEHKEDQPEPSAPPAPGFCASGYRVRASDIVGVPSKESAHEKLKYLEQMRRRRAEMQQSLAALAIY